MRRRRVQHEVEVAVAVDVVDVVAIAVVREEGIRREVRGAPRAAAGQDLLGLGLERPGLGGLRDVALDLTGDGCRGHAALLPHSARPGSADGARVERIPRPPTRRKARGQALTSIPFGRVGQGRALTGDRRGQVYGSQGLTPAILRAMDARIRKALESRAHHRHHDDRTDAAAPPPDRDVVPQPRRPALPHRHARDPRLVREPAGPPQLHLPSQGAGPRRPARTGHGHRGSGAAPDDPRAPARPAGPCGGPGGVDPREPAGRGRDPGSRTGTRSGPTGASQRRVQIPPLLFRRTGCRLPDRRRWRVAKPKLRGQA